MGYSRSGAHLILKEQSLASCACAGDFEASTASGELAFGRRNANTCSYLSSNQTGLIDSERQAGCCRSILSEMFRKGETNHSWLGHHCGGRRHMFSGMHLLLALLQVGAGRGRQVQSPQRWNMFYSRYT